MESLQLMPRFSKFPRTLTLLSSSTTINDLKDELIDILIRLPVEAVHRCKCVSKHWNALISSHYFISRYVQLHENSAQRDHLLIFHKVTKGSFGYGRFDPLSLLDESDPLSSTAYQLDFSLNFMPIVRTLDCTRFMRRDGFNEFTIAGISNGLMLLKATVEGFRPSVFYVSDPLTKQWLELPPLRKRFAETGPVGFMVYHSNLVPFKLDKFIVVVIEWKDPSAEFFDSGVFSSETGCWSKFRVACPGAFNLEWLTLDDQVNVDLVSCNGIFHLDGSTSIVAYDALNEPNKFDVIKYPPELESLGQARRLHLHVSEGKIRMSGDHKSSKEDFCVWELVDYDKRTWCLKYKIEIPKTFRWIGVFSQTNEEIVYFANWVAGELMLFNMKNGSPQDVYEVYLDEKTPCKGVVAPPFVMTSWPTPIPKLPPKNKVNERR